MVRSNEESTQSAGGPRVTPAAISAGEAQIVGAETRRTSAR